MRIRDLKNPPHWLTKIKYKGEKENEFEDVELKDDILIWKKGIILEGDLYNIKFIKGELGIKATIKYGWYKGRYRIGDLRSKNDKSHFLDDILNGDICSLGNLDFGIPLFISLTDEGTLKIGQRIKSFDEWNTFFKNKESYTDFDRCNATTYESDSIYYQRINDYFDVINSYFNTHKYYSYDTKK
jgi:hypothetical protein